MDLVKLARELGQKVATLQKQGFIPSAPDAAGAGGVPMDSLMGGGGAPPQGDPSMGGMPPGMPQDPSMGSGMPPPGMMPQGGDPNAMMAGPQGPPPGADPNAQPPGGSTLTLTINDLKELIGAVNGKGLKATGAGGKAGGDPEVEALKQQQQQLASMMDQLMSIIGGGAQGSASGAGTMAAPGMAGGSSIPGVQPMQPMVPGAGQ
jgi:hypothetical protein